MRDEVRQQLRCVLASKLVDPMSCRAQLPLPCTRSVARRRRREARRCAAEAPVDSGARAPRNSCFTWNTPQSSKRRRRADPSSMSRWTPGSMTWTGRISAISAMPETPWPARFARVPCPLYSTPATSEPRAVSTPPDDAQELGLRCGVVFRAGSFGRNGRAPGSRSLRAGSSCRNRSRRRCLSLADRVRDEPNGCSGSSRSRSRSAHRRRAGSEPHRHDDVLRLRRRARADQAAAVRVGEPQLDLAGIDRGQRVEQVVDVEADLELIARVRDLQLFLRFFLLRVVSLQRQDAVFTASRMPRYFSFDRMAAR